MSVSTSFSVVALARLGAEVKALRDFAILWAATPCTALPRTEFDWGNCAHCDAKQTLENIARARRLKP